MPKDPIDEVFIVKTSKDVDERLLRSSRKKLDPNEIPPPFHGLIGLAEEWGESDDILRERLLRSANKQKLAALANEIAPYERDIFAWLSGPEARGNTFSEGYIAFTALMMVYDALQE